MCDVVDGPIAFPMSDADIVGLAGSPGIVRLADFREQEGACPTYRTALAYVSLGGRGVMPSDEAASDGEPHGFGPRSDAELGEDILDVCLRGARADKERLGDGRVRAPVGDQAQNLALPHGQTVTLRQ